MNVLHIDDQPGWRGGEQQASYLIRELGERGHPSVVAGRAGSPFLEGDHGRGVLARVACGFRGEADPLTALRLARAVRRYDIDILHAHTSHAHAHAVAARYLARRGKVIVSRRVINPPRSNVLNRWKYAAPDRFVAVSHAVARVLREHGVAGERIRVVPSAVDPARLDVEPIPREDLGVPSGAPLLGCVAALDENKDQLTLLEALPGVLREVPELHVILAGEGPLRTRLEARIKTLGLEGRVLLLGQRDDVPAILRSLDAFALTSRGEGIATSIQDAMWAGVPVVATETGGVPELVIPEETGLLVRVGASEALAQALIRLLTDRFFAARVTSAAKHHMRQNYTIKRMADGNIKVYEEVLTGG